MSTEENKDLVRRYQEAHNSNKLDLLDEIVAADIITHAQDLSVPPGLEGGKQIHRDTVAAFPDLHFQIEDLIAEGDKVVARFRATATEKDSGKKATITGISIFRIAGGKIVEHWANQDDLGWYQQLGMAPPSGQVAG